MKFPHFRRRPPWDGRDGDTQATGPWRDSGLALEVEAFLEGQLVDHLTARRMTVPGWAALNRVAHADRDELSALVRGDAGGPGTTTPPWAASERFVAGRLLARAATPDELGEVQRSVLVPLELRLVERARSTPLPPERVLDAGADALDAASSDR